MVTENSFLDGENTPLCRFGPGGDFISDWPDEPLRQRQVEVSSIGKTLSRIAEIIGVVIAPELMGQMESANILLGNDLKEDIESGQYANGDHAETAANVRVDKAVSKEPTLFSDDTGISRPVRSKPNNRVRARRSTKRKKAVASCPWQGTLFETYGPSSQVA